MSTAHPQQTAQATRALLAEAERHAQTLFRKECDPNELGKALALLAAPDADVATVLRTLNALANDRNAHHSGKTRGYVEAVAKVVEDIARAHKDPQDVARVVGWAFRKLRTLNRFEQVRRRGSQGRRW